MILESLQNPKVKEAVKLFDRRDRDTTQTYLIEGYREVFRAEMGRTPLTHAFFCPELFLGENEEALLKKLNVPLFQTTEKVFRKLSYRDRPDGILAVAKQVHLGLQDLPQGNFYIVAESIEKPGNLGTILRSSDASATDALILCDKTTDIYNPNVVRASVGTLFTQKVIEATSKETLDFLKKNGIQIVAATPSAKQEYTQVDLTGPVAICVGCEQLGLSDLWMDQADICVKIPMLGVADSLNVATATTLLLYEAVRQRRLKC